MKGQWAGWTPQDTEEPAATLDGPWPRPSKRKLVALENAVENIPEKNTGALSLVLKKARANKEDRAKCRGQEQRKLWETFYCPCLFFF